MLYVNYTSKKKKRENKKQKQKNREQIGGCLRWGGGVDRLCAKWVKGVKRYKLPVLK